MGKTKVFLDSDVVISSLLSKNGASFLICTNNRIHKVISTTVKQEVEEVSRRLNIQILDEIIHKNLDITDLKDTKGRIVEKYAQYVSDKEDSHVILGAIQSTCGFLLTHNIKHYRVEKIKSELGVIVTKPGLFLQYLRNFRG